MISLQQFGELPYAKHRVFIGLLFPLHSSDRSNSASRIYVSALQLTTEVQDDCNHSQFPSLAGWMRLKEFFCAFFEKTHNFVSLPFLDGMQQDQVLPSLHKKDMQVELLIYHFLQSLHHFAWAQREPITLTAFKLNATDHLMRCKFAI